MLSYGAVVMWPAGVEPATPRVSSERSTRLSYGHVKNGRSRGSNRRPPPHQRRALATELSAVEVVCLSSPVGELDAHAAARRSAVITSWNDSQIANELVHATRLPFDPGSLHSGASYVEGCWSPVLAK